MKTFFLLLPCVLILSACATFGTYEPISYNFDDFVIQYGVPTSQYTLQNGDIAYSFVKQCAYTQAQEEVVVVVGGDNVVNKVSHITRCPSPSEEKRHNQYVAPQTNYVKEKIEERKVEQTSSPSISPTTTIDPNSSTAKLLEKLDKEKQENLEKLNTLNKKLKERESQESTMRGKIASLKSDLSLAQQTLEKMRNYSSTDVAGRNEIIKMKKDKIAQAENELKAFQSETSKLRAEIMVLEIRTK